MVSREEMSLSFGAAAGTYEAGRPEYPSEAVAWMLEPVRGADRTPRVVDVGAGTGKLTRVVATLGAEVVAVEPDADMLAVLHGAVPGVPTFVGAAEALSLPDASVDAVVLGQAWHWVDPVEGSREIARVLRAGGVLGLIWNVRDDNVPWVARMTQIMHRSNGEVMLDEGGPVVAAPFDVLESRQWRWKRPMTSAMLLDMARSRSYLITAEPDERARIEAGLERLFEEIGAVGDVEIELPYVTRAFRAVRPSRGIRPTSPTR